LVKGLKKGERHQRLLGVTGSGKTFTMANASSNRQADYSSLLTTRLSPPNSLKNTKNFSPKMPCIILFLITDYYQPEAYMPVTDTYIEKEQ